MFHLEDCLEWYKRNFYDPDKDYITIVDSQGKARLQEVEKELWKELKEGGETDEENKIIEVR